MFRRLGLCAVVLTLGSVAALAQSVISARSGLIHYVEGEVYLGDQLVDPKFGQFPEVKENAVLRATVGRAEMLLTPGVFLRLGENSSIKMISNRLIDTRVELLSGTAVVEADDLMKDNAVTIVYKDAHAKLLKKGLYRFTSDPAELRVFDGEAEVLQNDKTALVKEGKLVPFDGQLIAQKFDKEGSTDALNRWSKRRSEAMSMANVAAAKSLYDSGGTWRSSGWVWNPYFGMFTFVPLSGSFYSPYGYRFWSPVAVYRAYYAPRVQSGGGGFSGDNAGLGYSQMGHTSSGYSGAVAASSGVSSGAAHSAAPAPSAGASSGVSHSGGGGGGGGRR